MHRTECWFRNPLGYIHQLVECNARNIVFHRGYTYKNDVNLPEWIDRQIPAAWEWWRILHVGDQGSAEYTEESFKPGRYLNPVAVYPTWKYGADSLELLVWMLENPAGKDPDLYAPPHGYDDCMPRSGQDHRVIVTNLPPTGDPFGQSMMKTLSALQRDYPEVILHVHGKYSFAELFGGRFGAVDIDARTMSQGGSTVSLVNGDLVNWRSMDDAETQWVNVTGHSVSELSTPKGRCVYHIDAAVWASKHYHRAEPFRVRRKKNEKVDTDTPEYDWKPNVVKKLLRKRMKDALQGDMIACDVCSLTDSCRAYRAGSICTLPNSDGSELVQAFGSNDVDTILDGMASIMQKQAQRAEGAMADEDLDEGLNPEVTKILDGLFNKGEKFIKLKDPKRFKSPAIAIQNNVNGNGAGQRELVGAERNEQTLAADALQALRDAGWRHDRITTEMVEKVMAGGAIPIPPKVEIEAVAEAVLIEESQ